MQIYRQDARIRQIPLRWQIWLCRKRFVLCFSVSPDWNRLSFPRNNAQERSSTVSIFMGCWDQGVSAAILRAMGSSADAEEKYRWQECARVISWHLSHSSDNACSTRSNLLHFLFGGWSSSNDISKRYKQQRWFCNGRTGNSPMSLILEKQNKNGVPWKEDLYYGFLPRVWRVFRDDNSFTRKMPSSFLFSIWSLKSQLGQWLL